MAANALSICLECEHKTPIPGGRPVCAKTGVPIGDQAAIGCPLNKFATLTIGGIIHGAIGIARAVTGTGGADEEMIERRTAICAGCPHSIKTAGVFQSCELCGCSTWAKVRNADEHCPDDPSKW